VPELVSAPFFSWKDPPAIMNITVLSLPTPASPTISAYQLDYHEPAWGLHAFKPTPTGPADLLSTVRATGEFIQLVNDGSGAFTPRSLGRVAGSSFPFVADINGDGFEDLLVGPQVYLNDNGVIGEPLRFSTNREHTPIALADMDGDGIRDMLYFDRSRQGVLIYPGRPQPTLKP